MNRHCYHWVIALCSLFVLICTHCFPANIFASYLPFIKELGYSGAQASLLVTIRCIASFIGMTLVPLFYRRLNLRWGLSVSCLLMAVAFLIHSFAHNYATYVLGAAIMGLSYGLGGMIPVSLLMNNWFVQRRATALSISSMGIGLGSFIFPPIIVRIAQGISLDAAFRMVSLTSLVVMLLCFLIIRDTPFEWKMIPYGAGESVGDVNMTGTPERQDISRTARFLMLFGLLLQGGVTITAAGHYVTLFTSVGYSKEAAAFSVSMMGISMVVSKLIFGPAIDRWGGKKTSLAFLIVLALGAVCCCLSPLHPLFMYAGTLCMGLGFSPSNIGISIYAADFSSSKNYASLLKDFQRAFMGGGILFSFIPGKLFDLFGSYVISYWLFTGMIVAFTVILMFVYHSAEVRALQPDL